MKLKKVQLKSIMTGGPKGTSHTATLTADDKLELDLAGPWVIVTADDRKIIIPVSACQWIEPINKGDISGLMRAGKGKKKTDG